MPEHLPEAPWVEATRRRLRRAGVAVERAPAGGTLIATLRLREPELPTPAGPRRVAAVRLVWLEPERVKCVQPPALFHLPPIDVAGCGSALELERALQRAWRHHLRRLESARAWLEELGLRPEPAEAGVPWTVAVELEDERLAARVPEAGLLVLPSAGPLAGLPLARPEDRILRLGGECTSSVDLELALTSRMEELARTEARLREASLLSAPSAALPEVARNRAEPIPSGPILVVGPRLAADAALRDSLALRGFASESAVSLREAVAAFERRSFGLALVESRLGRDDGLELIPALRALPGIEEIPVLLVDEALRPARREVARSAGAAGYLVRPKDWVEAAEAIARFANAPRRRRFSRYRCTIPVLWQEGAALDMTELVGRGGACLRTDWAPAPGAPKQAELHVPELEAPLRVELAAVYRREPPAAGPAFLGVRFLAFAPGDEARWIRFLHRFDPRATLRAEERG